MHRLARLLGSVAPLEHSIAWAFTDGTSFVMDHAKDPFIAPGFSRDCDLTILTNAHTMDALFEEALDVTAPKPGQLFVWGGELAALEELKKALAGFSSVDIRARG